MRTPRILLAPLAVLALAACGSDDATTSSTEAGVTASAPTSSSASSPASPATDEPTAAPDRPAPGSCTDLAEATGGSYAVADAGTVTMTREGDRLVLGGVTATEGWETESVEEEDREIEVEFRQGDVELDFEAEIEDGGRLDVEICADDD